MAEPSELLIYMLSECPALADYYEEAIAKFPPSVHTWRIVVAWDEFTTGNKLSYDNTRKAMVLSFNFMELGIEALQTASTWMSPIVVRNQMIKSAKYGWSHMLALFLRKLLLGTRGFASAGVALPIHENCVVVFAKLTNLLSDGEGLQIGLDWKGASSWKPCLRHFNVVMKDSGFTGGGFVEITCHRPGLMHSQTTAGLEDAADLVRQAHERFEAGRLTKARYEWIEKSHGLNYNPLGLLWDLILRPHVAVAAIITYDWVHSVLQDGSLAVEVYLSIDACVRKLDKLWSDFESYLKDGWQFPAMLRQRGKKLHRIVSAII
jgi:hypothetical protein